MQDLTIFNNDEFGSIRTTIINNEPWFVGRDVAEALGYKKARNAIEAHVDKEDKDALNQGTTQALGTRAAKASMGLGHRPRRPRVCFATAVGLSVQSPGPLLASFATSKNSA